MRHPTRLSSLALCLFSFAATASERTDPSHEAAIDERPAPDTKRVEPPKAGSGVPVDAQPGGGADARASDKDTKRRSAPGFRLMLPAEREE
ncbi:MAG TPA: hypothetical protein VGP22_13235 [Albitalea sp.]|nr:hypothetical protein [Albitalea sp.]